MIDKTQLAWWVGLVTFVSIALTGQAELIREPWHHYLSVIGIIGTAITGYCLKPPNSSENKVSESKLKEINK